MNQTLLHNFIGSIMSDPQFYVAPPETEESKESKAA
jgi:hypothetical protein